MKTLLDSSNPRPATPDTSSSENVVLTIENEVATLTLGSESEPVVALTLRRMDSLDGAITTLESAAAEEKIRGLVVRGANPRMFCAGADLKLLHLVQDGDIPRIREALSSGKRLTAEEREKLEALTRENLHELAAHLSQEGIRIFRRLQKLPVMKVAAISGSCVGGGLELALHCDRIVAAESGSIFDSSRIKTELGFPEPLLGILEGWGGTELASRRIGLKNALLVTMQGKMLAPERAKQLGVVDAVVPVAELHTYADKVARGDISLPRHSLGWLDRLLTFTGMGRRIVEQGLRLPGWGKVVPSARDSLKKFPREHYPAPHAILEVTLHGLAQGVEAGSRLASQRFGELMTSPQSKALVHVAFFGTEAAKAHAKGAKESARGLNCLVLGAGQMGAGIAHALARSGHQVRVRDTQEEALGRAAEKIDAWLARDRKLSAKDRERVRQNVSYDVDLPKDGVPVDFILEAVLEDEEVKKKALAETSRIAGPQTFIATNTSSIPIHRLAPAVPDPSRFFGLHYFNPVQEMRLVEVVRGAATSDQAVAFGAALAVAQGKYPIVVADVPGFLINRMLFPYLNEAIRLFLEGYPITDIDRAARDFGMFMGPLETLDLVGLDIAQHVGEVLTAAYPDRMQFPEIKTGTSPTSERRKGGEIRWGEVTSEFSRRKMLGKKTGQGFYVYGQKGTKPCPNPLLTDLAFWSEVGAKMPEPKTVDIAKIRDRLVNSLVNEAVRCHEEGVAGEPGSAAALQIDLGSVMGFGFAPFRGGVMYYAQQKGTGVPSNG